MKLPSFFTRQPFNYFWVVGALLAIGVLGLSKSSAAIDLSPKRVVTLVEAEVTLRQLREYPHHSSEAHLGYLNKPTLSERLYEMPKFVLDTIMAWDQLTYKAEAWTPKRIENMRLALSQLPPKLREVLEQHLQGIYLVSSNFKGTGMCEFTLDEKLKLSNFMIFNVAAFDKSLDELLSYKVATNFIKDDQHCSRITTGTSMTGLYGILLHESMHVIDYQDVVNSYVDVGHRFWVVYRQIKPSYGPWWKLYQQELPLSFRSNIAFYGLNNGPKMKSSDMLSNYRELSQYPFASLYGAEKAIEDWAELGLFYDIIHAEGSDYKEEILDGDKVVFTWRPQDHPALKERLKDVSKWLERNP